MNSLNMNNYFDAVASKFAEETNHRIVDFLGSGSQGHAYLTEDNKVIKVTTDLSEYNESKKLLNVNAKHITKIYDCFIVESEKLKKELPNLRGMWVILLEKVDHNRKEQEILWSGLEGILEVRFGVDSLEGFLQFYKVGQLMEDTLKNISDYLINLKTTKYYFYFLELIEMMDELNFYGIKSVDYGPSNFGFRNNTLVFFDLGFGDENDEINHKILKF